ncbi:ABC transporter ATP-binding protein [Albidovulum sp.]
MSYVSLKGLRKSYGSLEILKGLDLEIPHHQFTVLLGPSGCGKSTTLRLLAGLEPVSGGKICIDGRDVTRFEPRERDISMVFQNYALYPSMTVEQNMGFGLKARKLPPAEIRQRVHAAADLLGITPLLARRPRELSGGQQQRVAIGRAIVREPKVFLFDEPLSNLDAKLRVEMRAEILQLHRRLKATTIYVTHDQEEAMTMADRIVIMNAGEIEQEGTPEDIFFRPQTRMVAGFIGSPGMNFLPARIEAAGRVSTPVGFFGFVGGGAPGQKVEVGIRPDDLLLARDPATAPDGDTFRGEISLIELLGPRAILHLHVNDTRLLAVVAHDELSGLSVGKSAAFYARPGALHVFERDTGIRL